MQKASTPTPEDDLARWAQPLILDRLSEVYYGAQPHNHFRAATLVALHARVWRAMICGEAAQITKLRRELLEETQRAHLTQETLAGADKAVFEELYTVVRKRFRASRHLSVAYLRPLHNAVQHLQESKLAA